jgi:hypothetical protein
MKFIFNGIEFKYIEGNLNLNSIQFNLTIGLRFNSKEMGCKFMEKILKICLQLCCWKEKKDFNKTWI